MAESRPERQNIEPEQSNVDSELDETADKTTEKTPEMSPTFDFKEKSWMTDFTLVAEGTKFYVAKNILALASPVFKRRFESDLKEKICDELELVGKRAEDVNEFLLAIYPSTPHAMSKEKAMKILPLAEEYQVLDLKKGCEDALLGSIDYMTTAQELYQLIKDSHLFGLHSLYERCIHSLSEKSVDELEIANTDIELPAEPLREILQNLIFRMKETELSNLHKAEKLETSKTWINYFSKAMKRTDVPKLSEEFSEELDVIGKSSMVTMNIVKKKPVEDCIMLSNTKLNIQFDIKYEQYRYFICARLGTNDKNDTIFNVFIQFVVVNRMPLEEHISVKHEVTVKSNQPKNCRIVELNQIENPKEGFVVEEKIQIEVNVFMSKPKKA